MAAASSSGPSDGAEPGWKGPHDSSRPRRHGSTDERDRALDPARRRRSEGDRPGTLCGRHRDARPAPRPPCPGDARPCPDRADRPRRGAGGARRGGRARRGRPADRDRRHGTSSTSRWPATRSCGPASRSRSSSPRRPRPRPTPRCSSRSRRRRSRRSPISTVPSSRARRGPASTGPTWTPGLGRIAARGGRRRIRGVHAGRAGLRQRGQAHRVPARRRRGGARRERHRGRGSVRDELGPPGLPRTAGGDGRARRGRRVARHRGHAGDVLYPLGAGPAVRSPRGPPCG